MKRTVNWNDESAWRTMPTACGHQIPPWHRYPWHDGPRLYCSATCMGIALAGLCSLCQARDARPDESLCTDCRDRLLDASEPAGPRIRPPEPR
jgi:hypothetical protein